MRQLSCRRLRFRIVFALIAAGPTVAVVCAETGESVSPSLARCQALAEADFAHTPDAPTEVSESKIIDTPAELLAELTHIVPPDAMEQARGAVPTIEPFCRVTGYVAPSAGFELLLPVGRWNGKFLYVGCAGWCGSTAVVGLVCAKHPGYACLGTDMGHRGSGGLWLRNNLPAQVDFSDRATHVTTLAGKAITERYYASSPTHAYFLGCSTGGYQGMMEAQRFPADFDGIIAGAPDMDQNDLAVRRIWMKQHFLRSDGQPLLSLAEIAVVHHAALAKCDLDDGVKDGVISDPAHCSFDPVDLLCKGSETEGCLSAAKVQAVKSIYGRPVTSRGVPLTSRGVFPGSENNWRESFLNPWDEEYLRGITSLASSDPDWTYRNFDFDDDYPRSGAGLLFANTNPDLRRFKTAGGKLITYQGGSDAIEPPGAIVDYYETVERTMGGRSATLDFFRLFVIPGMDHCSGGDGAFALDYLSYLEAWVEQDKPPDVMIGAHIADFPKFGALALRFPLDRADSVTFTRPVYPYPLYPRYKGKGDPNKAENFAPVWPRNYNGSSP